MKRKFSLLLALLLCLLTVLSACQKTPGGEEDQTPQGENSDTPSNKIEELKLELYTENASSDTLLQLQEKLPQQVKDVLTEKGYEVGTVSVSYSTSVENSISAVAAGTVNIAWIDATSYVSNDGLSVLAGTTLDKFGTDVCGLICTAPTEKGLAVREKGGSAAWEDLSAVTWGVVDPQCNDSYHYANVWLNTTYGKTFRDIAQVKTYENPIELLRASAKGEVDMMALLNDDRTTYAELWTLAEDQANADGVKGFGRQAHISDDVKVLSKTAAFYPYVAACKKDSALDNADFGKALAAAMNKSLGENMELFPAYLQNKVAAVKDAKLDPQRKMTLENL